MLCIRAGDKRIEETQERAGSQHSKGYSGGAADATTGRVGAIAGGYCVLGEY